ncbi:hypothetical protein D3C73_872190 [compost metagenome]
MQFRTARRSTTRLLVVHIHYRAVIRDKLQLFLRHPWVIGRVMDQFYPQSGQHKANHAHHGKDVFPAPGEGQPAQQR